MTENGKNPKRRKKDSASVSSGETIDLGNTYKLYVYNLYII